MNEIGFNEKNKKLSSNNKKLSKENAVEVVSYLFGGFIFGLIIGGIIVTSFTTLRWERESVKNGFATYSKTTGSWEWIKTSKEKGKDIMETHGDPYCEHCRTTAFNAKIINGTILHEKCIKPFNQAKNGKPFKCIHCKTAGTILDTSRREEKWVSVNKGEYAPCSYNDCRGCRHCGMKPISVHPSITCPTCEGHGYTEVEYEPIIEKVITGYKRKI